MSERRRRETDLMTRLRRRERAIDAAGLVVTGMALLYAAVPMSDRDLDTVIQRPGIPPAAPPAARPDTPPIDPALFAAARFWNPVPDLELSELNEGGMRTPPPEPTCQLVGVISDGRGLAAALYDPSDSRISVVRAGDRIEPFAVIDVRLDSVILGAGGRQTVLKLSVRESSS